MKEKLDWCEVIQDLLPLYEDDCCSPQSRALVEEHLETCEACRRKRAAYEIHTPGPEDAGKEDIGKEDVRGIRQGMRVFLRWRIIGRSVLGLLLTAVFLIIPVWNHVRGMGLTYGNLGAVHAAYAFERALASGDYEKAYGWLDLEYQYRELLATERTEDPADPDSSNAEAVMAGIREVEENGFDWYDGTCREAFLRNMRTLEEREGMIRSCSGLRVQRETFGWRVCLDVRTDAGEDLVLWMDVAGNRIRNLSASVSRSGTGSIADFGEKEQEDAGKMYDVLYRMPSVNETVMEILYGRTDYDWTMLSAY